MLCMRCKKNQATKTKERTVDGKKKTEYYCADCYRAAFLLPEEFSNGKSVRKCPYCGRDKEKVLKSGLVGCANCYASFADDVLPIAIKMQGDGVHAGKAPYAVKRADRLEIRYRELQVLIRKHTEEQNLEKVKEYSQESRRIRAMKEKP